MENFDIYKNETSALSFGGSETSGYAFVKLDERYATKGFFLGEVTNTNESLQKLCNRVSEKLFDNGYYKKLMKLAIEQINLGKYATCLRINRHQLCPFIFKNIEIKCSLN